MGLFDLFKKKDAAFYLTRAKKELHHHKWVSARDDAKEGLECDGSPEVRSALQEVMTASRDAICRLNLQEAEVNRSSREFGRALECLEIAKIHADGARVAEVEAMVVVVRDAKADASRQTEVLLPSHFAGLEDEGENELMQTFQVYLAGLAPDVAEIYGKLSPTFMEGYVALNAGDPRTALQSFARLKPRNEVEAALIAFEQGRALLMGNAPDRALVALDVAASVRGANPIFSSDHPSIPFLRYEALAMMGKIEEAADALREGLKASPGHPELRPALASILIALEQHDEAEALLDAELSCSRSNPEIHVLRARLLDARGNPSGAIEALEAGLKSCGCSPSSLPHPLLARSLADLYVTHKQQPQRVETLLNQLFRTQQGEGEWVDYYLKAKFLKWQGDENLARASWKMALDRLEDPRDPRRAQVEALFSS